MVRVCLLLPDLAGGGAERVTLVLAGALAARGYEVDLALAHASGPLLADVPAGVRVHDLGARRTIAALPALRRYLRARRPGVVISALTHVNVLAVVATRVGRRTPLVVVEHNTLSAKSGLGPKDRLLPVLTRLAYRGASIVAAVSQGVADDLAKTLRRPPGSVRVLVNPIDYDLIIARAGAPHRGAWQLPVSPLVLAIGRLTPQKDFPTLLRAMAQLPPPVRLLLLGEGEDRAVLTALAETLGIADRVDMPGFVENPYPYFARADVVVLSSRWEGLPTVLLEALPFSARLVSTDCPSGPREILADGRFGRLVPVGDPQALAGAISDALAEAPDDRAEACRRYNLGSAVDAYSRTIDEAMSL